MRTATIALALAAFASPLAAGNAATLKFTPPDGWVSKPPASSMRLAEFTLPKVAGDAEDATVTVFFFGATQGGAAQANVDRWISQMAQPDGKASKDVARTTAATSRAGLKLSIVDVSGTYVAEVAPGSAEHFNKTNFRQVAVYVETTGGPHFIKLLGPSATVARWHDSFHAFLESARYE